MVSTFKYVGLAALILLLAIVALPFLDGYIPKNGFTLISLLTIAATIKFKRYKPNNLLYPIATIFFLLVYFSLGIQFGLFMAFFCGLAHVSQLLCGRLNTLPIFSAVILSSLFSHFEKLLGLPIRLALTEKAGEILKKLYGNISVSGSVVELNGHEFYVDTACLGLNMLAITLLISLILISRFEQKMQVTLPLPYVFLILGSVLLLSVLNNFIRIITIIIFNAAPETVLHDILGVLTLGIYALLPLYFIVKYLIRFGIQSNRNSKIMIFANNYLFTFCLLIGVLFSFYNYNTKSWHPKKDIVIEAIEIKGLEKSMLPNNVVQFTADDILVYIKPKTPVFKGDHSPMFCWRGSGYKLRKEQKINIKNHAILLAELQKEDQILYTAWWYSNGESVSIDQLEWRGKSVKSGTPFRLVNITANSKEALREYCEQLIGHVIPQS